MSDITIGRNEAEDLDLDGYEVERRGDASGGEGIRTGGTGLASGTFDGEAGRYRLTVNFFDENDGASTFAVLVNGEAVSRWTGSGGRSGLGTLDEQTAEVDLAPGDTIAIQGERNEEEYGRIDSLDLARLDEGGESPPSPPPVEGASLDIGLTEAEALDISGDYEVQANGAAANGQVVGTLTQGAVSGSFAGADGTYDVTVNFLDESDGVATFRLLVDGAVVSTWQGTGGRSLTGTPAEETVRVALRTGDEVSIEGVRADGEAARLDSIAIAAVDDGGSSPPPPPTSPPGAEILAGTTQAETLDLSGDFEIETRGDAAGGQMIRVLNGTQGGAAGTFRGEGGDYTASVTYFDESDGVATFELLVNGAVIDTWQGTGGRNGLGTAAKREAPLSLEDGDIISLRGAKGGGELARFDQLTLVADGSGSPPPPPPPAPPPPPPPPTPDMTEIRAGLTEAEALDLSGDFEIETRGDASSGQSIRVLTGATGDASGVFRGEAGAYTAAVTYFDESDGVSDFEVLVNGVAVDTWQGTGGRTGLGTAETREITLDLEDGDTITLRGTKGGSELARFDSLELTLDTRGDDAAPQWLIELADVYLREGESIFVTSDLGPQDEVADPDTLNNALTFAYRMANGEPLLEWMAALVGNRGLSITEAQPGTYTVEHSVSDGTSSDVLTFDIIVEADLNHPRFGTGRTEAEDLDLDGFEIETRAGTSGGEIIRTPGTGTASGTFGGKAGTYYLTLDYLDESDGASDVRILVDGIEQAAFTLSGGGNGLGTPGSRTFELDLQTGSEITIEGTRDAEEFVRLDALMITEPVDGPILAPVRVIGAEPRDGFAGVVVDGVGDIDGDGLDDFVAGFSGRLPEGGDYFGTNYLIFGSSLAKAAASSTDVDLAALAASDGIQIAGEGETGRFVKGIGDIDGDGRGDIIVEAIEADPWDEGVAARVGFLIFGDRLAAETEDDNFIDLGNFSASDGLTFATVSGDRNSPLEIDAGDTDGDGTIEILFGIRSPDTFGYETFVLPASVVVSQSGGAYIDPSDLFNDQSRYIGDARFALAGDLDGDGLQDFMTADPYASPTLRTVSETGETLFEQVERAGAVSLVFSGDWSHASLSYAPVGSTASIVGTTPRLSLGEDTAAVGDVNGDGFDDLLLGTRPYDDGFPFDGKSYLVFGGAIEGSYEAALDNPASDQHIEIIGATPGDGAGNIVGAAGDVDGDGLADIIIAAPRADRDGASGYGEAYILFGAAFDFSLLENSTLDLANLTPDQGIRIIGKDLFHGFALESAVGIGDVDGDGLDDVAITSSGDPLGRDGAGEIYILSGALLTQEAAEDGVIDLTDFWDA